MRLLILLLCATAWAEELRLITIDPAHFHAAQLYTGPLAGYSREAVVYGPPGRDFAGFWTGVSQFLGRSGPADYWRFQVYAGDDFLSRMKQHERPGQVVMLSGRNQRKLEYLQASLAAGEHALVDKPWIIEAADLPKLEAALAEAERRKLVLMDCMTQRFEVAYQLQRELVNDPNIMGAIEPGTPDRPAVEMASSHFLLKVLNGVPNLRPAWYFDIAQQGEALADVGTHVVDLTHWTLFSGRMLDYRKDIRVLQAKRWATVLNSDEFRRVTGEPDFPDYLRGSVQNGRLMYYTNNSLLYTVRGIHVALRVTWEFESPLGNRDSMLAIYRGGLSEIAVRAGRDQQYVPELDVTPRRPEDRGKIQQALTERVRMLQTKFPGIVMKSDESRLKVQIPKSLRANDVNHFQLLAGQLAEYIRQPATIPAWERSHLVTKYFVTTQGVALARQATKSVEK